MTTRDKLLSALTDHDRREQRRPGYNPYALAHYAKGLQNVDRHLEAGHALRDAIITEFCGRLCDKLLKVAGLPLMTDREARRGLDKPLPELADA